MADDGFLIVPVSQADIGGSKDCDRKHAAQIFAPQELCPEGIGNIGRNLMKLGAAFKDTIGEHNTQSRHCSVDASGAKVGRAVARATGPLALRANGTFGTARHEQQ